MKTTARRSIRFVSESYVSVKGQLSSSQYIKKWITFYKLVWNCSKIYLKHDYNLLVHVRINRWDVDTSLFITVFNIKDGLNFIVEKHSPTES